MADNIKIVGNILNTTVVSRYSNEDNKLIPSKNLTENFGGKNDYIEFYIYDVAGNLLNTNYNYLSYKLPPSTGLTPGASSQTNTTGNIQTENVGIVSTLAPQTSSLYPIIEIDPIQDLQNNGYSSGEFNVKYNLFQNILSNYIDEALFIKEISPDRTEIRLGSVSLTNDEIESVAISMIDKINNSDYYVDYLLNFGNNEQYVAINVALNKATTGYEVLFKLYQPLPNSIQEKQTLWIVEEKVSPYVFDINLDKLIIPLPAPQLRGPNFGIEIPNHSTVSTTYTNYNTLITGLQSIQSSSYQQILNLLATQSININVDYTDFDNFIFFGSSKQRVNNFYTKVKQIEDYNNLINNYTPLISTTPSVITEINKYSSSINEVISQFDGYESYLYFNSSSYTWPKSGSLKPYKLFSTGSSQVSTWYSSLTSSAEYYDKNNPNNLEYAIPNYLKDNPDNQPFLIFINMVGHYFDNIWIYLKAITDVNLANNNLNTGISKDLVYNQLKSLGLHLYNSQAGEDVNKFLIGNNKGSGSWDNNTTITGSYLNNIPRKDLVAELYKRIYHNLPLILKQKGTVEGLDNLISIFGIPSRTYYKSGSETFYTPTGSNYTASILNVKEYGGSNKSELIKGYNTDKVRIVSNTITGSVLSPLRSLQTFPTDPSNFRDGDMHYIDISFSPQTQIDTYASKSISSNNSSWSLDDYIGDPRQQYDPIYSDLETQRKLYYQTGVTGYPGFTGSLLDYNGFIRLIQYFDNSLFKMLEDFVPERASLSTGVTFNSPVLERNKAVYANPTNSTTQSVYEAQYTSSNISSQYGHFYEALQGDKKPYFDGVLSGSTVDVHQYFVDNYNPYLLKSDPECIEYNISTSNTNNGNTIQYTPCNGVATNELIDDNGDHLFCSETFPIIVDNSDPGQIIQIYPTNTGKICNPKSFNLNNFNHSDWNVLLNNVSASVVSAFREKIEYGNDLKEVFCKEYNIFLPSFTNGALTVQLTGCGGDILSMYIDDAGDHYYCSEIFPIITSNTTGVTPTITQTSGNVTCNPSYRTYIPQILYPAELQDSYLFLQSYNISRYEGSKLTSLLYNKYTSTSYTGSDGLNIQLGDNSYGKTAVIDRYSRKIGLFTQVENSKYLPLRNNVALKYLIDEFGNLTELNQQNTNWMEVQRTFLMGTSGSVSLFDNKKYGNQKFTDGGKYIFDSGYFYSPILYFANCGYDATLAFESTGEPNSYFASARNDIYTISGSYIKGNATIGFPLSSSLVMNLFNYIEQGGEYFSPGTLNAVPSYSVQQSSTHRLYAEVPFTWAVNTPPTANATWSFEVIVSGSTRNQVLYSDSHIFVAGDPAFATLTIYFTGVSIDATLSEPIPSTNIVISSARVVGYRQTGCVQASGESISISSPYTIYKGARFTTGGSCTGYFSDQTLTTRLFNGATVNGVIKGNGSTIVVGGTLVTVVMDTSCY